MNTRSPSASPASAARVTEFPTSRRLVVVGLLCALATWLSIPRMTRYWTQTAAFVEQLHVRANGPSASLPQDALSRQLAGWNGR